MNINKAESKIEKYEIKVEYDIHLYVEETEKMLEAYFSIDGYGYRTHLIGVPKKYYNDVKKEEVINTKESFLEDMKYYIDENMIYWYFKDMEKLERDE